MSKRSNHIWHSKIELQKIARDAQRQDRLYLLESRTGIEKGIIELAIANATADECLELQNATQNWLESCTPEDVHLTLHDQIHMTMAHMTGNLLLVRVLQILLEALPADVRNYGLIGTTGSRNDNALEHELSIHSRLTAAIVARDLPLALAVFDEQPDTGGRPNPSMVSVKHYVQSYIVLGEKFMRIRQSYLWLPGLLTLTLILLSGCTAPAATTESDQAGATDGDAGQVTLRLASYGLGDAWNAKLQATVDVFTADNPDIAVDIEFRPIDAYWDKLQTEFAAGTAPDVTINQMDWVIPGAARGMFVDLQPLVEQDQIDMDAYFYDMSPEWGWQGGLYGGLLYAGGQALYVNKDLLAAAGLEFPEAGWTWDDMLAYADAMTDADAGQWGIYISPVNPPYWGASFIHGAGGAVLNDEKDQCALTSAEAQAGLQYVADLIFEHEVMPAPVTLEGQANPFVTGKVGLLFGGTWQEGEIREAGFDWDFAPMPAHPDTGIRSVQMGSNAWSILGTSEHPDEAWELVKFLMGEGGQRGMMANGVPGLTAVVESAEYQELHQPQQIRHCHSRFRRVWP